jgi:hypothetical protein
MYWVSRCCFHFDQKSRTASSVAARLLSWNASARLARVERDRRTDAGDEGDDLEQRPQLHAQVAAAADDEVRVIEHLVI